MAHDEIIQGIIDEKRSQQERPAIDKLSPDERKDAGYLKDRYVSFLDHARTTHETTAQVISLARKHGFEEYRRGVKRKFYIVNEDQSAVALVLQGKEPIEHGISIIGAHADFCCLHLKEHPIKEDSYLGVRLDARPYGGFWNHHYFDTDVKVIGRFVKDNKTHTFSFDGVIFDPTIHINHEIEDKTVKESFKGEMLDIMTGCRTKKDFLRQVTRLAGIEVEEKDFSRADVYAVPKFDTLKLLDEELVVGYGHDDRSSVFTSIEALFRALPTFTTIVFSFDREEIGSTGLTGAIGSFFERVLDTIIPKDMSEADTRALLRGSRMISADVDVALNHRSMDLSDQDNAAKPGRGIVICRVNGGRGQGGGNRAPAFLMDELMSLWDREKVVYQVSSIPSKVDQGGGGTIGRYFAERGIPTADCGAPVSGMHGKRSIIHTGDLYQCMKGFKAFIERKR